MIRFATGISAALLLSVSCVRPSTAAAQSGRRTRTRLPLAAAAGQAVGLLVVAEGEHL